MPTTSRLLALEGFAGSGLWSLFPGARVNVNDKLVSVKKSASAGSYRNAVDLVVLPAFTTEKADRTMADEFGTGRRSRP
jgi:hypothetical protein